MANKIIKREIEVAFSKHAQPVWFRVVKYVLLGIGLFFFWNKKTFWIILLIVVLVGIVLHLWFRYKTQGWTKSYGLWNYEKNKPKEPEQL